MLNIKDTFCLSAEDEFKLNEIFVSLRDRYKNYKDPWGFNLELIEKALRHLVPIYRSYFRVRVFGAENVENKPYIIVSNHTGQIPLDAMLITIALLLDVSPPRVLRAMVERFMAQLPFIGDLTAQTGSILGDRANCEFLINNGESILVFPEGVSGVSKNTTDYYKLQKFSQGFYKIALQKRTPILPICVIGAEEMFPLVFHSKKLAKIFNVPALPLTANLIPLPSPIDIYIGKAITIPESLGPEATDKQINENIYHIEHTIKRMIITGLKNRRPFFDSIRKPLSQFMLKGFKSRVSK